MPGTGQARWLGLRAVPPAGVALTLACRTGLTAGQVRRLWLRVAAPVVCSVAPLQQLDGPAVHGIIDPTADPALVSRRLRAVAPADLLGHDAVQQCPQPIRVLDAAVRTEEVEVIGRL